MSAEKLQTDASAKINNAISKINKSKLLSFDEENKVSTGKDINVKITALDSDLTQLRVELSSINSSVEEGMDRLGDSDTDLTAKVSETYKRLGEIDNAYKSLLEISSRIDNDLRKLNGDISEVAEQTATGIKTLEKSTVSQSKSLAKSLANELANDLANKNNQVVSKVNQIVETSKITNEMMYQNIQSATEKMLLIEKNVVAQIDNLTSATRNKTESIVNSVDINKAKILKLQSVDEAIIRRATTLEITTAELSVKGQYIDSSVEQLQISSDTLSNNINLLSERTDELEALTVRHSSVIDGLQKGSSEIAAKLIMLAGREKNHFNFVLISFLFLLVAATFFYFTQQYKFDANAVRLASSSSATKDSIATLENKIQHISYELNNVQDQVHSVAGRISQSPFIDQIGDDNIIHGPQWIAGLSPDKFTVQLAYVDNKEAIYEIAQSYNFHLKDSLSYFVADEAGVKKYILLSGSYATSEQAMAAVQSMPGYIDRQQPVIRNIGAVQKYIAAL